MAAAAGPAATPEVQPQAPRPSGTRALPRPTLNSSQEQDVVEALSPGNGGDPWLDLLGSISMFKACLRTRQLHTLERADVDELRRPPPFPPPSPPLSPQ